MGGAAPQLLPRRNASNVVRHGAKDIFYPQKRVKTWVNKTLNVGERPLAESLLDSETNLIFRSRIAEILMDFSQNFGVGLASLHDFFYRVQ